MKSKVNSKWLIKSAGQVIGPYTDHQVGDLLRSKVVVPLDEASVPCGRWCYIRDTPVFAKIIEEMRIRYIRGKGEDTITLGDELTGITETVSTTQPDELTSELTQPKAQTVQDILFHSIDDNVAPKSRENANVFTHESDSRVKREVEQSSKWIWGLTGIVIFVTLAFVVFQQFIAKPIQDKSVLEESVAAGIDSLEFGDYDKALDFFKRAHAIQPNDTSIYLYLGILTIQIEGQGFQGRKILETLIANEDKDLKRILTGVGLAYLKEGDYKSAEINFNKALDIDPLFQPALINLGATAILQQDWTRANNNLQLALKEGSQDGVDVLMLTEVLIRLSEMENEKRYLFEAAKYLSQFLKKSHSYSMEASVAAAYVAALLGDKQNIYAAIDNILDMDSLETESHRQNLFIHRSTANWALVSQWCLKLTQDLDPNAHVIAFEALCLFKANDLVEANRKIDDALAQAPKDPLVLSIYAIILREINSNDKAIVAVDKALALDAEKKFELPRRLKARYCRESDNMGCQSQYWSEVLQINPASLSALAGMAQVNLNSNNIVEAKKYLLRGLSLSSNYRPFIPINKIISRVEDRAKARGL